MIHLRLEKRCLEKNASAFSEGESMVEGLIRRKITANVNETTEKTSLHWGCQIAIRPVELSFEVVIDRDGPWNDASRMDNSAKLS